MLGLVVDLDLRMVGAHVAFAAVFGLARQGRTEGVPAVASGAAALAAIGIDAPDTAVGPGGEIELAVA